MKSLIKITLVLFMGFGSLTLLAAPKKAVKKEAKKVEMDLNRVWTFTFEELSKLPDSEKEIFKKQLVNEAQNNLVLLKIKEATTEESFKPVLEVEEKWNSVASKINSFCQDSHNYDDCLKIAKIRKDLVIKNSNHR